MAALTHVCMWSGNGWKHITAEEAARLHPGGTVSAHSGLFMCELCGQYVSLTEKGVRVRHFRHSQAEKSKDCPERVQGTSVQLTYGSSEHELPIRIRNISKNSFSLDMGFIPISRSLYTKDFQLVIKGKNYGSSKFVYLGERINQDVITYLPIGDTPCEEYSISVTGLPEDIYHFWPRNIAGIDPAGTVFDAKSGKKLVKDADVAVGRKYLILRRGSIFSYGNKHISIREISQKMISWESWKLYEVVANDYDESSARFFLDYYCRLSECPVDIQTVWPVYIENPYIIKHNQKKIMLHVKGNAPTTQVFPYATKTRYTCGQNLLIEIACNSRQQLISAGRTKALQYTYFWQEPLNKTGKTPSLKVTDIQGILLESGIQKKLPNAGILRVVSQYDGMIDIAVNNTVIERRKLTSESITEINSIAWGMTITIYIGQDQVWQSSYIKNRERQNEDEKTLLQRLNSYKGKPMALSHTFGSVANMLSEYPSVRKWILQRIREGNIDERAYRELQNFIIMKKK